MSRLHCVLNIATLKQRFQNSYTHLLLSKYELDISRILAKAVVPVFRKKRLAAEHCKILKYIYAMHCAQEKPFVAERCYLGARLLNLRQTDCLLPVTVQVLCLEERFVADPFVVGPAYQNAGPVFKTPINRTLSSRSRLSKFRPCV